MNETEMRSSGRKRSGKWLREVITFARISWSSGGAWDRLFLLLYPIWTVYFIVLQTWVVLTINSPEVWLAFWLLWVPFLAMQPVWKIPLLASERVISALIAAGQFLGEEDNKDARVFADYLLRWGKGGRWKKGQYLSLAYFGYLMGAGLLLVFGSKQLGEVYGISLTIPYLCLFFPLLWLYNRSCKRFIDEMDRRGYPVRRADRLSVHRQNGSEM